MIHNNSLFLLKSLFSFLNTKNWISAFIVMVSIKAIGADQIVIHPDNCVVEKLGDLCNIEVKATVQLTEKGQYCFYLENSYKPLKCFDSNIFIGSFKVIIDESQNLILLNERSKLSIYKNEVSVMVYQPSEYRKRRRFGFGVI